MTLTLSKPVARQYLLGRQGLYPGPRWRGKQGTHSALHTLGSIQMDPLVIIAPSHHLVLHSRVADYKPQYLDSLMYQERRFFDYGGHLDIYPIEELPYWRVHMRHRRTEPRWSEWSAEYASVIADVRRRIQAEGPLGPRDFTAAEGETLTRNTYRGSKAAGIALHYLWLTGELMTHSRRGSEKVYDLAERIAPSHLLYEADEADAGRYLALKWLRSTGLTVAAAASSLIGFGLRMADYYAARSTPEKAAAAKPFSAKARLARLVEEGHAAPARVEGVKDQYFVPAEDVPLLETLAQGKLPRVWKTRHPTTPTDQEVTFLSPLDNLLDRRRTKALFDFDYTWEIYVKPEKREYGPYTLPVLYGDQLVARLDAQLQRKTNTLAVKGFWPESPTLPKDPDFAAALTRGLQRLAAFLDAGQIAYEPISTPSRSAAALMSRIVKSFKGIPSAR